MSRKIPLLFCLVLLPLVGNVHAEGLALRLEHADAYRQIARSVVVETQVSLYKDGKLDRQRDYRVYIKSGRRSLVVFKTPSELGQKVLMRGDDFHLFLPSSRRAIRITPMQKLLGEASTGDVANMTWHEDYDAKLMDDKVEFEGTACRLLALQSRRPGSTYARIDLYLARSNDAPVYARLYLTSGKLAKSARYQLGKQAGRTVVVGMSLVDNIRRGERTEVRYRDMRAASIPDKYFNPQYLLRAPLQ